MKQRGAAWSVYNLIREDDENKLSGTIFDTFIVLFILLKINHYTAGFIMIAYVLKKGPSAALLHCGGRMSSTTGPRTPTSPWTRPRTTSNTAPTAGTSWMNRKRGHARRALSFCVYLTRFGRGRRASRPYCRPRREPA